MKKTSSIPAFILFSLLAVPFGAYIGATALKNDLVKTSVLLGNTTEQIAAVKNWHPQPRIPLTDQNGDVIGHTGPYPFPYSALSEISTSVPKALIATEDKTFYSNPGIDPYGMIRAAINNATGHHKQGASTITQQLAKQVFLHHNTRTWSAKKSQIIMALRLNNAMSKQRIMELYLNTLDFGHGSIGISSAASLYFNTTPDLLNIQQSATLAGIIKSPAKYDPFTHKNSAIDRRNTVLSQMHKLKMIDSEQYESAIHSPLIISRGPLHPISRSLQPSVIGPFGWIDDLIVPKSYVQNSTTENNPTTIISEDQMIVETGFTTGLMAYTATQHPISATYAISSCAEPLTAPPDNWLKNTPSWAQPARVCNHGSQLETESGTIQFNPKTLFFWMPGKKPALKDGSMILIGNPDPNKEPFLIIPTELNGSAILSNAKTGAVLAMTGGVRWTPYGFNRAISAKRAPGSTVKPFIYLTAIEAGWTPDDIVYDVPVTIPDPSGDWSPENDNNDHAGPISLKQALAESRNLATVNLAYGLGFSNAMKHLYSTGLLTGPLHPASVLGSSETTVWQMTQASQMFANAGIIHPLHITTSQAEQPVIETSPDAANSVLQMMKSVLEPGGTMGRFSQIAKTIENRGYKTGAKTGTTSDFTNTWTVAIAGPYVLTIQCGYDTPKPIGPSAFASSVTAPIAMTILNQITGSSHVIPPA